MRSYKNNNLFILLLLNDNMLLDSEIFEKDELIKKFKKNRANRDGNKYLVGSNYGMQNNRSLIIE